MKKDHKTLLKFLLPELPPLDLLRKKNDVYTRYSRVCVSATSTVFKIMILNLQHGKNKGLAYFCIFDIYVTEL